MRISDPSYSPDGKFLAYLEQSKGSRLSKLVVATSCSPAVTSVVATAASFADSREKLSREEKLLRERQRKRTEGVTEFIWSPEPRVGTSASDLACILIPFRGNLYLSDIRVTASGELSSSKVQCIYRKEWLANALQLPTNAAGGAQNPKFSPNGSMVGFHAAGELWVIDVPVPGSPPDRVHQVSYDDTLERLNLSVKEAQSREEDLGSVNESTTRLPLSARPAPVKGITRGIANYLEAEELDRYDGFWFSPDGTHVCFQETDSSRVPQYTICHTAADDPVGSEATEVHQYPFAGGPNPRGRIGIAKLPIGMARAEHSDAAARESAVGDITDGSRREAVLYSAKESTINSGQANGERLPDKGGQLDLQGDSAGVELPTCVSVVAPAHPVAWLALSGITSGGQFIDRDRSATGAEATADSTADAQRHSLAFDAVRSRLLHCEPSNGLVLPCSPSTESTSYENDDNGLPSWAVDVAASITGTILESGYIARVNWAPDGSLFVQVLNRTQTVLDLVRYRLSDGACDLVLREVASHTENEAVSKAGVDSGATVPSASGATAAGVRRPWINVSNCLKFVPYEAHRTRDAVRVVDTEAETDTEADDGGGFISKDKPETFFIWGSERTGYQHLYLYRVTSAFKVDDPSGSSHVPLAGDDTDRPEQVVAERGQQIRWITRGKWNVQDIISLDAANGDASLPCRVYFYANARSPLERHVYRAPVFTIGAAGHVISPKPCPLGRASDGAAISGNNIKIQASTQSKESSSETIDVAIEYRSPTNAEPLATGQHDDPSWADSDGDDQINHLSAPAKDMDSWGLGCSLGSIEIVTGVGFGRWHHCALLPTSGNRTHEMLMLLTSCSADAPHEHRVVAVGSPGQARQAKELAVRVQRNCVPASDTGIDAAASGTSTAGEDGDTSASATNVKEGGDGIQLVIPGDDSSESGSATSSNYQSPHSPTALPTVIPSDVSESQLVMTELLVVGDPPAARSTLIKAVRNHSGGSSDEGSQAAESQYSGHTAAGSAVEDGLLSRRSPDEDSSNDRDDTAVGEHSRIRGSRSQDESRLKPPKRHKSGGAMSEEGGRRQQETDPNDAADAAKPAGPASGAGGDTSAAYNAENRGDSPPAVDGQPNKPSKKPEGSALADLAWRFFSCPAPDGETTLIGAVLLPDSGKHGDGPYPAVVSVYGGPHAQLVCENANSMQMDRVSVSLARSGIAVMKLDNRGSAHRGTAFEGFVHKRLGTVELEDQLAGLRHLAGLGLVDLDNRGRGVGVRGWSYGGYMTLMLMCKKSDIFRCGVAGAPVTSWEDYDTAYTERYHSTPQDNPEGYKASSVLTHVKGIKGGKSRPDGQLLLIHGLIDENVIFRHSARLMRALMQERIRYDTILLPSERHTPRSPDDLAYIFERSIGHLKECLLGAPKQLGEGNSGR